MVGFFFVILAMGHDVSVLRDGWKKSNFHMAYGGPLWVTLLTTK